MMWFAYIVDISCRISKNGIDKLLRDTTFSDDGEQKEERYERRGPDRRARGWQERNERKPYERPRTHYDGGQRAKEERYGESRPHRDYSRDWRSEDYGHRPRSTRREYEDCEPEEGEYQNSWEYSGKRKGRRGNYNNHRQTREWSTNDYSQNDGGYSQRDDYHSRGDGGYSQRDSGYSQRGVSRYSQKDGYQYDR